MSNQQSLWSRTSSNRSVMFGVILFSALLVGVMWGAVFALLRVDRENTIRAAVERNDTLAIALEEYAVRTIKSADDVVQSLVREYKRSGGKVDLARFVVDNAIDSDEIFGVVLADERGEALATIWAGRPPQPLNVADLEYFRINLEHDSGKLFIGKPVTGRVTGYAVIPFTRRINKADGTFGGVAIALVRPARFTDILQDAAMRPQDTISLVGLDGITRARLVQSESSSGQDISKSPLFGEQAKRPVGNFLARGQLDGVLKFFSYRTLPYYPIMATIGTPQADVLAAFYQRQTRIFWAAGSVSAVIFGFTLLLLMALGAQRRAFALVARSEARSRGLLTVSPDGICIHRDGEIQYANDALVKMLGYQRPDELVGRQFYALMHPDMREVQRERDAAVKTTLSAAPRFEAVMLRQDGSGLDVETSAAPYVHDGVLWTIAIIRDITERKAAEARIAYLNRVYAMLSGINTLIVRAHDRDELFNEACRIAVEAGGFRMAMINIVDRSVMKILPVATAGKDEALVADIKKILSSGELASSTMVARAIREKQAVVSNDSQNDPQVLFGKKYAEAGVCSIVILPLIVSNEATGALALYAGEIDFFHEEELKLLTELAGDVAFGIDHLDKQEKLNYLAYYDALTGLANRSLFLERVAQYMRSAVSGGHKLALCLIDLERFKNINDSLGWSVGDALLKQVTEWLTRNAGDANLLARVGADHFALVLPEVMQGSDVARQIEKTLAALLNHPFRLNDAVFRIAAKVGIALFPDDGADADTLFKNAEAALKMAKRSGDRYLFHAQKMTEAVAVKLTLENQLRQALDNEEFVLHYQPKVTLASGKVTSAEALIRWNDPRRGLVPPAQFIPILEEIGLIYDVGRWALRKAIADTLRWRSAGLPAVRIAVNVSALQVHNRDFVAEIKQIISIDAHAAEGLELEITESLIMEDVKHSIDSLRAIRAMGITIAIDDFGTGFSSLGYLSKLPVDTLKIDRSFVIDMTDGPEGLALVSTIINLAHSLKLKVVAEGVETEEQSRLLRLLNCDEMQGFLFSKPVPAEIFEAKFLAPSPAG